MMPVRRDLAAWEMTDPAIRDAVRGRKSPDDNNALDCKNPCADAAVLAVGSLEQHGPHLPVSTDLVIASEVARMVSERCGYLLLPAMPYGVSHEHAPLFHASVTGDLLRSMTYCLRDSLGSYGVRHMILINGHHGNMDALDTAAPDTAPKPLGAGGAADYAAAADMHVFHYWRHMPDDLGHAGFAETSMMLAISPSLVRMDLAQRGLVTDGMPDREVRRLSDFAKKSFVAATGNGVWGDPAGSTAQAGRRMLEAAAGGIARACRDRLRQVT